MTQDWKDSCLAQTEIFFKNEQLTAKNYKIERQQEGPITKFLYKRADELIKELAENAVEFRVFNTLQADKWNPGDIWMVSSNVTVNNFASCKSIRHLNEKIYELYLKKHLIPISLKKIDNPNKPGLFELKNSGGINFFGKYRGHNLGAENGFSFTNNNMVIKFTLVNNTTRTGECKVRPFTDSDVSAEIEGVAAAGGKAGRTFINKILENMGQQTIYSYKDIKNRFDNDYENLMMEFFNLSKQTKMGPGPSIKTVEDFKKEIQKKYNTKTNEKKYVNSKLQCTSLAVSLEKLSAVQKDELVDKMITYASSEIRQISSFHVKVGK